MGQCTDAWTRLWAGRCWYVVAYRLLVLAGAAVSLAYTWPLWQTRTHPPLLPLAPVPQFDVGWLLLASLIATALAPRLGLSLYASLTLYSFLQDQTRMQPHVWCWFFLVLGTLPGAACQLLGRMYLLNLWFFAGFHKLVSPLFIDSVASVIYQRFSSEAPAAGAYLLGGTTIVVEIALALLAMFRRTRPAAAMLCAVFHLAAVALFSPWGFHLDPIILCWNAVLAGAGVALLLPWKTSLASDLREARPLVRIAALVVLVMPAGYYLGLVDANLAHHMYSENVPTASLRTLSSDFDLRALPLESLGVIVPANHRAYEAYFRAVGKPGQTLVIEDPRWCARVFGYDRRVIPYQASE